MSEVAEIQTISRSKAIKKIRKFLNDEKRKLAKVARANMCISDYKRVRNYEIQEELGDYFGGKWALTDFCPFNGIFCESRYYVDSRYIQESIDWWVDQKSKKDSGLPNEVEIFNCDVHIKILSSELGRRELDGKDNIVYADHLNIHYTDGFTILSRADFLKFKFDNMYEGYEPWCKTIEVLLERRVNFIKVKNVRLLEDYK